MLGKIDCKNMFKDNDNHLSCVYTGRNCNFEKGENNGMKCGSYKAKEVELKKCNQCVACETIDNTDLFCHQANCKVNLTLAEDCPCFELLDSSEFIENDECGIIDMKGFDYGPKKPLEGYEIDSRVLVQQMQLERVIGELNVLQASYYNCMNPQNERYKECKSVVETIINDLKNTLG